MIRCFMAAPAAKAWPDLAPASGLATVFKMPLIKPAAGPGASNAHENVWCLLPFFRMENIKSEARGHIQGVYSHICGIVSKK